MELQEVKQSFTDQLQQEYDKIQELTQQLQQHQQQALKLQGALEATNLIIENISETKTVENSVEATDTLTQKRKKIKVEPIINTDFN